MTLHETMPSLLHDLPSAGSTSSLPLDRSTPRIGGSRSKTGTARLSGCASSTIPHASTSRPATPSLSTGDNTSAPSSPTAVERAGRNGSFELAQRKATEVGAHAWINVGPHTRTSAD